MYPKLRICEECSRKEWKSKPNITVHRRQRTMDSVCRNKADGNVCGLCGTPIEDDDEFDYVGRTHYQERSRNERTSDNGSSQNAVFLKILAVIIIFAIITVWWIWSKGKVLTSEPFDLKVEVTNLKKTYQNQNPFLWQNVLKMTNSSEQRIHVLILLYKGSGITAECIAKDLAKLINKMHNRHEGISIYDKTNQFSHYGEQLVQYHDVIKESKHLVVLDLSNMPWETARMFQTLCDESMTVKPSYFIFTLEDMNDGSESQRNNLITRAGTTLRKAWSNMLENELHPLLSRMVRNVAEISHENVIC